MAHDARNGQSGAAYSGGSADAFPDEMAAMHEGADPTAGTPQMYQRLGELTRKLHDALRELDLDKKLEAAAHSMPDARDRLSYIATLTGQAADRVLTAVECGQAEQAELADAAAALSAQWLQQTTAAPQPAAADALVRDTRALLDDLPRRTAQTRAQFHDIMMAQDFHDLTGQVIGKLGGLMQTVEANLLEMLVETRAPGMRDELPSLSGPAIRPGAETAANQSEVDDLLGSLGF